MSQVQSPEIGSALRTALSLDAAGGMPLGFEETIFPVAIVADVRELLTNKYIPAMHGGLGAAVVGEYTYSYLEWQPNSLPRPKKLLLDSVRVSVNTAASIYLGFMSSGIPASSDGLPRRKIGSLQSSAVAGRVQSGTSVNDYTMVLNSNGGNFAMLSSSPVEIVFREPIILDGEGQAFAIGVGSQNVALRTQWQWREER